MALRKQGANVVDAKTMKGLEGLAKYVESRQDPAWKGIGALQAKAAKDAASRPWPRADEEEWRRSPLRDFDLDSLAWGGLSVSAGEAPGVRPWLCNPVNEWELQACADLDREDFAAILHARLTPEGVKAGVWVDPALAARGLDCGFAGASVPGGKALSALEALFARGVDVADNRFQSWALAAPDLLCWIHVPAGLDLDRPVVVDLDFALEDRVAQVAVLAGAGESSRVKVIERLGSGKGFLLNAARLLDVGDNARLDWELIQDLDDQTVHTGFGHAVTGRDSRHSFREAQLGAGWIKARHTVDLGGEGSEAFLEGISFGSGSQHVDLRTVQNHRSPKAWSRAIYKSVVKDQARTIYQGMIHVDHQAVRTDAFLTNNNVILNDGARADSIPSLNIETDDVKCSHGSTTGKLDPDEIFYLQNRGFSVDDAREFLVTGFLDQIILEMSPLVRTLLQDRIRTRIEAV